LLDLLIQARLKSHLTSQPLAFDIIHMMILPHAQHQDEI
jgi:hypothetical protein